MKRIFIPLYTLAALAVLTGCNSARSEGNVIRDEAIPVKVLPLQSQSGQLAIPASGQFTTEDETLLSFKTGGIIQQIHVNEGDAVRKGQLLATIDPTETGAGEQQARIAYEKALRDQQRYANLYRDSVATLEQLQNTRTALGVAREELSAASFNRSHARIHATANGFVLKKFAAAGQVVSPGMPVLQTNDAGQHGWILKVGVGDKEWSAIAVGDRAVVETDAFPGTAIEARVTRKARGIDPVTGTFLISLSLNKTFRQPLAAGLFGKAVIYPDRNVTGWSVPYDALLDGDRGEGFVFVTNDGKTARKVKVSITGIENRRVLVRSGLEKARSLVVSGSAYLKDGSLIRIIP